MQAEPEWYSNQQWNQWQQEAIRAPPGLAASKVGGIGTTSSVPLLSATLLYNMMFVESVGVVTGSSFSTLHLIS